MDDSHASTIRQYVLRHIPAGILPVATDARGEGMDSEAALRATGTAAGELPLQRTDFPAPHGTPKSVPVLRMPISKWL